MLELEPRLALQDNYLPAVLLLWPMGSFLEGGVSVAYPVCSRLTSDSQLRNHSLRIYLSSYVMPGIESSLGPYTQEPSSVLFLWLWCFKYWWKFVQKFSYGFLVQIWGWRKSLSTTPKKYWLVKIWNTMVTKYLFCLCDSYSKTELSVNHDGINSDDTLYSIYFFKFLPCLIFSYLL